jgi:uncharacterized protein YcbX
VADLWRYPVKSFAGERARRAFLGPFGVLGDRRHALVGQDGRALSARRAPALLGYRARYADAEAADAPVVITPAGAELGWDDPLLAEELEAVLGAPVTPAESAIGVHDCAPVHLVTDASLRAAGGWIGEGLDPRRFRPNLVLELDGPEAFAEAGWTGARLQVGHDGPLLDVVSPTERCAITTFDPDTLERDTRVLASLARERENLFGVYARVARPGWLEVGAPVRLAPVAALT